MIGRQRQQEAKPGHPGAFQQDFFHCGGGDNDGSGGSGAGPEAGGGGGGGGVGGGTAAGRGICMMGTFITG
jgi:hypothetical protein